MSEITLKEIEVTKLNLQLGEVLMVTVKNDELDLDNMEALAQGLRTIFPNNKVAVMNVGTGGDLKFQVLKELPQQDLSCASSPAGYCSDCNCGKREQIEGVK